MLLWPLIAADSFAAKSPDSRQTNPAAARVMDYAFPDESTATPRFSGTPYTLGWTYWDMQHYGSMGRQVGWGYSDTWEEWMLHTTWTYRPAAIPGGRRIAYNGWISAGTLLGEEVGPCYNDFQDPAVDIGGYSALTVTQDGRALMSCNHMAGGPPYRVRTWWEFYFDTRFYTSTDVPSIPDETIMWPAIAYQEPPDGEPVMHILGSSSTADMGNSGSLYYFQKVGANETGVWTHSGSIDVIFNRECYDIAASNDGVVALAWIAPCPPPGSAPDDTTSQDNNLATGNDAVDNNLYYQINRNYGRGMLGDFFDQVTNWWENRVNLTRYEDRSSGGRNDYRPSPDMSALITPDNVFHISWVSRYGSFNDMLNYRSRIFHWSEDLGFDAGGIPKLSTVSTAEWQPTQCNPGKYNFNQAKVSLSECDGKLYTLWVEFNSPMTSGNQNQDDCSDRAFHGQPDGAANGDLFVGVSDDAGFTWAPAIDLTNTYGGPTNSPFGSACDPANLGIPCPCEHWPSMTPYGSDHAVNLPAISNVLDISENPPYSGTHYLDITYIDDWDPGAATLGYGSWQDIQWRWYRLTCSEPIKTPNFGMTPTSFEYPSCVKNCQTKVVEVTVENIGNDDMYMTVTPEEDPSAFSGWLTATGFAGTVPAGFGNVATGEIIMNNGGVICQPGWIVEVTGRVLFDHNAPSDVDTFFVELVVADTCILPQWDTIATNCTELTISNHGAAGNAAVCSGVNLDYVDHGVGEWLTGSDPARADIYLFDASTVLGYVDGSDTVMNWSMYNTSIADSASFVPLGGGADYYCNPWADCYDGGQFANHDTTIGFTVRWFANTDPAYSCGFVIKETRVYSLDGAAHNGIMVGEIVDWDVPSDSSSSDNSSGFEPFLNLMWQRGTEWEGFNDEEEMTLGGWDETERYAAVRFLGGHSPSGLFDIPQGMYTACNSEYIYPYQNGFDPGKLYELHSGMGFATTDSTDTDLFTGMTYVFDYTLGAQDTLYFYTAFLTTMNESFPSASGGPGLSYIAQDAMAFFDEYVKDYEDGCCINPGDADHSGSVDISDLVYCVDYMFGGGPGPICVEEFDNDGNCVLDISDLTYFVDYLFGGGPPPVPCHSCD